MAWRGLHLSRPAKPALRDSQLVVDQADNSVAGENPAGERRHKRYDTQER
jgi:hypothetical protein